MVPRTDVAVIGAGVVGVSSALHLLMRGKSVVLLDRSDAGRATSYGNAGIIDSLYGVPYGFPSWRQILPILLGRNAAARLRYADLPRSLPWIFDFWRQSRPAAHARNSQALWPLRAASLDEHRALMRGTDAEKYVVATGRLSIYRSEASFAAGAADREVGRALGVPFETLDAREVAAFEPALKPAYYKAVRWPDSRRLSNPGAVVSAYEEKFVRAGGIFVQSEVRRLVPQTDGWRVETLGDAIEAKAIVIAAGPWAADMLRPLGYRFPLGFKRGYHLHFAAPGGAPLAHAVVDAEKGFVIAGMERGYRLVTGVEIAGLRAPPNPVQIARTLPYARELFPLGAALDAKAWCGARPCFADSLPAIGPAPRHDGLWLNFGHGHLGMMLGPPSGRLLAEMMTGENPFCDPRPYRAARFSC